jgi:hypothetical protein
MIARPIVFPLVLLLGLSGCGAREARPVQEVTGLDDRLTCEHIQGELATNTARRQELAKETEGLGPRNAAVVFGLGLVGALAFGDTGSAQRTEQEALTRRDARLVQLAADRNCVLPPQPVPAAPLVATPG